MIANAATTYCMMKDVDCSMSGGGLVLLIGIIIVAMVLMAWWGR